MPLFGKKKYDSRKGREQARDRYAQEVEKNFPGDTGEIPPGTDLHIFSARSNQEIHAKIRPQLHELGLPPSKNIYGPDGDKFGRYGKLIRKRLPTMQELLPQHFHNDPKWGPTYRPRFPVRPKGSRPEDGYISLIKPLRPLIFTHHPTKEMMFLNFGEKSGDSADTPERQRSMREALARGRLGGGGNDYEFRGAPRWLPTLDTMVSPTNLHVAENPIHIPNLSPAARQKKEAWEQEGNVGFGVCLCTAPWCRIAGGFACDGYGHIVTDELFNEQKGGILFMHNIDEQSFWEIGPFYGNERMEWEFGPDTACQVAVFPGPYESNHIVRRPRQNLKKYLRQGNNNSQDSGAGAGESRLQDMRMLNLRPRGRRDSNDIEGGSRRGTNKRGGGFSPDL